MKKAIKTKWLKALRSGEFDKTTGQLRDFYGDHPSFCCLGVLCEISKVQYHGGEGVLPDDLAEKVGLDSKTQELLAALNDGSEFDEDEDKSIWPVGFNKLKFNGKPRTFKQIANVIEKYL